MSDALDQLMTEIESDALAAAAEEQRRFEQGDLTTRLLIAINRLGMVVFGGTKVWSPELVGLRRIVALHKPYASETVWYGDQPLSRWNCDECLAPWPCLTITAVAEALGVTHA